MKATRRGAFQALISLPVLAHDHEAVPAAADTPAAPKAFSQQQFDELAEWADLMLPGAKAAGVASFIDWEVSRRPATLKSWRSALAWFKKAAAKESRAAVLERISKETSGDGKRYFELLKGATIDAYYSTRAGLQGDLGWNANTFLTEFPGCTHKEHQG